MAKNKIPWLRQRTLNCTIKEHTRCSKGANQKNILVFCKVMGLNKSDQPDSNKRSNEGPKVFLKINQCFPIHHIP